MNQKHELLLFNPRTVENVRKEFNLDQPGAIDQAIDILRSWLQKQEHFVKKDFPREYLERFLVASKGSVEKTKRRLDRVCTMRTMVPNLFEKYHPVKDFPRLREFALNVVIPEPTEDDYRLHIVKLVAKDISAAACLDAFQHHRIIMEYGKMHDYAKGYINIFDLSDVNITDAITKLDLNDNRNMFSLITEGHGIRIMGIYVITSSNTINALINLVKPFMTAKIMKKITVLKSVESLYDIVPRKLLPKDYGGDQKAILEMFDEMNEQISSEENVAFFKEMNQACTNEQLRRPENFNQEYLGMPGSFKLLSVD